MNARQKKAFRELLRVANDNGKAVDQAISVVGNLEARQGDFEALLAILAGVRIPGDFLSRRAAINDDREGGDNE